MKVTILGTAGGIPIPNRAQAGVLVELEKHKILLDCGMAIPLRLAEMGVAAEEIDMICLTHGHLDHVQDLPTLSKAAWLRKDRAMFDIISPPELKSIMSSWWKAFDEWDRVELDQSTVDDGEEYIFGSTSIEAFDTPHKPESQGYKITDSGKSIVYTGDTAYNENLKEIAEGVDILIHELSFPFKTDLHITPEELIDLLSDVSIKKLILVHFYPHILDQLGEISKNIEGETGIKTIIGEDLLQIEI
ncbi:MAG: MBL fold metallo-hydrolase [Thermoplasmatota archaeon]